MATLDDTIGTQGTAAAGGEGMFTLDASASDPLTLPEGLNPAMADFSHEGADMVMTWPDGSEVTVTDYFMVDPQPTLASDQGAQVSGELAARLSGPVAPGMVAEIGSGLAEQPIGQVEKMVGTVTVIRADGTKVELKVGDQVFQGDILETGADGALGVILADETTFSMAEEGRMVLDEMIYDPGTQEGSVSFSVMHGVFTFVSGQVAKTDPDAMTLHTPVATIGIRGTQLGIDLSDGQNLQVALMEEGDGFVGEVVISNDGGVSVLNGANESTSVSSFNYAPTETVTLDTQHMVHSFGSALNNLPTPANGNANTYGMDEPGALEALQAEISGETEANADETEADADAAGLADFDTAAGGEDTPVDPGPITPQIDIIEEIIIQAPIVADPIPEPVVTVAPPPTPISTPVDNTNIPEPTPDPVVEVTAVDVVGQEDGTFALNIGVTATDTTVESVTVSGVPSGAALSAGSDNGDGSWTLGADQLSGLTITPPLDFSGTFDLTVTATPLTGDPATSTVSITPVADVPILTINPSAGLEDQPIDLNITSAVTDVDGSEVLFVTIGDVPTGATLSAGEQNVDGTWSLTPAQLDGLQLNPPADFNGDITLSVTSTSTDTSGVITDSASVSGGLTVSVAPVGDTPDITLQPASGAEDGSVSLNIGASATGGETIASITISGVPTGASLSLGTDNGNGSWTLTDPSASDLSNLTMTPPADFAGSFSLAVTATSSEGGVNSATMGVDVTPVADAPTLTTAAATGAEDSAIALNITTAETDVDGSETLSMTISGVPTGAELSAGTDNLDGTWTLDPATDLANLTITPPLNFNGTMNLTVTSTSTDTLGNVTDSASTVGDIAITVVPVGDQPGIQLVGNSTGAEDGTVDIGLIVTPANVLNQKPGTENVDTVTITGVPAGGTLNVGTLNDDGSWTITSPTASQLTTLTMTPPADYSGTPTLGFTVVTNEGGTNSADMGVTVTPVADAPTLTTAAVTGAEDSAIALNITTAETDVDGSETLSVTIGGVPSGAELSAGTLNQDGSWTLTPEQLTGLTLTPDANFNGSFDLTVTSTSTDGTDTASTTNTVPVTVTAVADGAAIGGTDAAGTEDNAIALDITATSTGGVAVNSITITGVPSGASLTAGTDNGGGSWTLTPDQLTDLSLNPAENYSGSFDLNVTATSADGTVTTATSTVAVEAVADAPTLSVSVGTGVDVVETGSLTLENVGHSTAGYENSIGWYTMDANGNPVSGEVIWADTKQSVDDVFTMDGVDPSTIGFFIISDGGTQNRGLANGEDVTFQQDGDGNWQVIDSSGATLKAIHGDGAFFTNSALNAGGYDHEGDSSTVGNMNWEDLRGGGDQDFDDVNMNLTTQQGSVASTTFPVDITSNLVDTDGSETLSLTVSGIPTDATLSVGTHNADGSWTLTPDQLSGLTVTVPSSVSADFDLTVTATATEPNGDTASVSQSASVDVTPDAPDVTVENATGNEDTAIALDISSADAATVVVSGVPTGASLSAGTDNGGGTWTLTSGQLDSLTITPPNDYSGTFDLSVTATSAEGVSTTTTSNVDVTGVADAPTLTTGVGEATETGGGTVQGSDYSDIKFGEGAGKNAGKGADEEHLDDHSNRSDSFVGDDGRDYVDGMRGDDMLAGKGGADELEGGKGDDVLFGGAGDDELEGDSGDDILFGGSGNNEMEGGSGDDIIIGGSGNDDIEGGSGNDVIFAGGGNNKVDGDGGNDTMVFTGARSDYLITEIPGTGGRHGTDTHYIVEHLNGGDDGVSMVEDIEIFQFMDGQYSLSDALASNPQSSSASLTYDISIDAGTTDVDGSETLSDVTITGVPDGASFSAGTDNGGGSWTVSSNDLQGLSLNVTDGVSTDFSLSVSVTSTEPNGSEATTTSSIDVGLPTGWGADGTDGAGDGGVTPDTSVDALDPLSKMFEDSDTLKVGDEEYDISSLTDGDTADNYGGAAPLGTKNEIEGYDANNSDASDGYSVTPDTPVDDGTGGGDS